MNDPKNGRFIPGTHWRPHAVFREKAYLEKEYIDKGRSSAEIASEHGVSDVSIRFWMIKHGIPRRQTIEARKVKKVWRNLSGASNPMYGRTGASNPGYRDGSSPERQRLYSQGLGREFLRTILARDFYRCRRCGAKDTGKRSLHVHHLKPWAGNPALRLDDTNVVTLCRPCHNWVHSKKNTEREFLR